MKNFKVGDKCYITENAKVGLGLPDGVEYRIKEEKFEDGRSEFYPQFLGKVFEQRRSVLDNTKVVFDEVDGWITLNKGGYPNDTYDKALEVIKHDKRSMVKIEETIHDVD